MPRVSVVIPTYQRPDLVQRALRSVLDQTVSELEVVVVVDGRDAETIEVVTRIDDGRCLVHVPDRHLGNSDARNAGVALARARWVAFLDDDDAWCPQKLERQLAVAEDAGCANPIVVCRFTARAESGDITWPRRLPAPCEDLGEYFFCRRTPFTGEGMIIMSSILTTRALLAEVPFASGLSRHVDPDWLLRAVRRPDVGVQFVADTTPLLVWHIEEGRSRITTRRDWAASYEWCRERRHLLSKRAYAAFLLHVVGANAAAQRHWRAFPLLLREAFANGQPAAVDVAAFAASFSLPTAIQRRVAVWYSRLLT